MKYGIPAPIKHILIGVASRHGSTDGITEVIAETFGKEEIKVPVFTADEVTSLEGYDAAIIGSTVYDGEWLEDARSLLQRHAIYLRMIPVYLLSSGPIGTPGFTKAHRIVHIESFRDLYRARVHRVFSGALSGGHLSRLERFMAKWYMLRPVTTVIGAILSRSHDIWLKKLIRFQVHFRSINNRIIETL